MFFQVAHKDRGLEPTTWSCQPRLSTSKRSFWPHLCHTDDRTDRSSSCIRYPKQQNQLCALATNSSKDNYSHFPILGSVTVSGWVKQLQLLRWCQSSYRRWEKGTEHDVVYLAAVYLPFITHEADDDVISTARDSQNHNIGFLQERQGREMQPPQMRGLHYRKLCRHPAA